ncbi:methylenetetrahydrofolate reductase [Phycicoccus endophyticus]|uniref:Methylenetetrahydrofolate reductase n=1 Tax=Phycicoccus endophyticus TaxID=1690220 RepID=A0A7G9QYV1_9MICO|nr:methylenetetrahydrofolate reductase [Phycicoccus endophyticus]NHI20427.1 5,10-methylenetetrahydrofolate reductase [Phycicoccus endophyticus]QNN48526.1 methylenetetrahydrofolate reductase [Phycicoccus endophyticus]GGL30922.1 methylenetetrahydrofolate reductase [Phycicoccus endophyticus]
MSNELPTVALVRLLEGARYEVMPTASVVDAVGEHVPPSVTVTVTAAPGKGLEATLSTATTLARAGWPVVPHLAARMLTGRGELQEVVARLAEAGVTAAFVPGGDADPPAGDYDCALDLLRDLATMEHPFTQVGITGYPESHPTIDDDVTVQAMWDKRAYATHIVSNMTFDAEHLGTWCERVRRRRVELPLLVGVPGPVERTKLLGMATKIGVGESLRFLRKQKSVFARIAAPGFSSDRFVSRVAALSANPALGIAGLHVFTFNQVGVVETWRQGMLARAREERVHPTGRGGHQDG